MDVSQITKPILGSTSLREEFPQLAKPVRGFPLVYLDNAATTLMPRSVSQAMASFDLGGKSNVHRGAHYHSDAATSIYERVREQVATFINATDPAEIIFTKGTTEGINLVAHCFARTFLKPGDEILISNMEHHSNIVPWQLAAAEKGITIRTIPVTNTGEIDLAEYRQLLTDKVKLVAVVYISNSLGTVNPISEMSKLAHQVGAKVLVDAAQSVAALPTDVQALNCDFLAFSAHKMFGPFGVGVLWGRQKLLNEMPPYQGGGSMITEVTMERSQFLPAPQRFEAGTPNVTGVVGLGAAIDFLTQQSFLQIRKHEKDLLTLATERLLQISGVRLIGTSKNKTNILSFVVEGLHSGDIGAILDQQGIAVRTGHHCTQPLMARFNVPGTVRASFSIYNTAEEVDLLVAALKKAKEILQ